MAEIKKHGASGYSRGCRCADCRAGHTVIQQRYRARRKERETLARDEVDPPLIALPAPEPQTSAPAIDMAAAPGPLERAIDDDIAEPDARVAWRRTLVGTLKLNARILDQLATNQRLDLVSGLQLRMLEMLRSLAILGFAGLSDDGAGGLGPVPDDAGELLDGIMNAGSDGQG